jgi:hypothetical protein
MNGSTFEVGAPQLQLIPPLGFRPYPIDLALDSRSEWLQVGRRPLRLNDSGYAALQAERWADPAGTDSTSIGPQA